MWNISKGDLPSKPLNIFMVIAQIAQRRIEVEDQKIKDPSAHKEHITQAIRSGHF